MKTGIKIGLLLWMAVWASGRLEGQALKQSIQWSGYMDWYYSYDFNEPETKEKPNFLYNHTRHNELNLNLGYIKAAYADSTLRANLAVMAGTYVGRNLSGEPAYLQSLFEANLGIKLSKKRNFWLDIGIFPSHIGFESAISKDCVAVTRSISAENTPYFESGVKATYTTHSGKWVFAGLLLNGWQRIERDLVSPDPALGTQITWTPNGKLSLNHSFYLGNEYPTGRRELRVFHNLYAIWKIDKHWQWISGLDYGVQNAADGTGQSWYAHQHLLRYNRGLWAFAVRFEDYQDKNQVITSPGEGFPLRAQNASLNVDYQINSKTAWRSEFRFFQNEDPIFWNTRDKKFVKSSAFFTSTITVDLK